MTDEKIVGIPLNKRGTERLQVSERETEGKGVFVDVRKFYLVVKPEGDLEYLPTKKGVSLSPEVWAMVIDVLLKSRGGEIRDLIADRELANKV
jgi:hypothetical protein